MRVRVCDQCGSKDGVRRYKVTRTQETPASATQDLCVECGAPLEKVLAKDGRRTRRTVVPIAQVAAAKKASPRKRK